MLIKLREYDKLSKKGEILNEEIIRIFINNFSYAHACF
jgi:hypothetical protein